MNQVENPTPIPRRALSSVAIAMAGLLLAAFAAHALGLPGAADGYQFMTGDGYQFMTTPTDVT
jgi:hypothetical protein